MKTLTLQLKNLVQTNPLGRQIALFLMIGGLCYFIGMGLLLFFAEVVQLEVNLANAVASIITIFFCYLLNAKWVFEPGRHSRYKEIAAFYLFASIGLVVNIGLMYLMTSYTPLHYLVSKTLIILFVAVFNFATRKFIVFKG